MKKKSTIFEELLAGVQRSREAASGSRAAAPTFQITAMTIKKLRGRTRLSQPQFAVLLGVELSTLRNWEQGRREPTGPARALLRAIRNDPERVIRALARPA
jgi:putative transcriptional regulator